MLSETIFSDCGHLISKRIVTAKAAYYEQDFLQWMRNYSDETVETVEEFYVGFCNQYGQLIYTVRIEGETPLSDILQFGYRIGLKDLFEDDVQPQVLHGIPFSAMFMVDKTSRH